MSWLILNQTNCGQGIYTLGTVRSHKRAWKIVDGLNDYAARNNVDDINVWTVVEVRNVDPYKDNILHDHATQELTQH